MPGYRLPLRPAHDTFPRRDLGRRDIPDLYEVCADERAYIHLVWRIPHQGATAFNQNIGNWNTANVEKMMFMFDGASAFHQDIGRWNTENVTSMRAMFRNASHFDQNLENWYVNPTVYNHENMFQNSGLSKENWEKMKSNQNSVWRNMKAENLGLPSDW